MSLCTCSENACPIHGDGVPHIYFVGAPKLDHEAAIAAERQRADKAEAALAAAQQRIAEDARYIRERVEKMLVIGRAETVRADEAEATCAALREAMASDRELLGKLGFQRDTVASDTGTAMLARLETAERERDEARIAEKQARAAVLKTGQRGEWAAVYAWLDQHKDEAVKRVSDNSGEIERENAALREKASAAARMAYNARTDLSTALIAGAARLDRNPMEFNGVLLAVQAGHVSSGWARDAFRRWLHGLSIDTPGDGEPEAWTPLACATRWKALAKKLRRERDWHIEDKALTVQALCDSENDLTRRYLELCNAASSQIEALEGLCWALLHGWMTERRSARLEAAQEASYSNGSFGAVERLQPKAIAAGAEADAAHRLVKRALAELVTRTSLPAE